MKITSILEALHLLKVKIYYTQSNNINLNKLIKTIIKILPYFVCFTVFKYFNITHTTFFPFLFCNFFSFCLHAFSKTKQFCSMRIQNCFILFTSCQRNLIWQWNDGLKSFLVNSSLLKFYKNIYILCFPYYSTYKTAITINMLPILNI